MSRNHDARDQQDISASEVRVETCQSAHIKGGRTRQRASVPRRFLS